MKGDDNVNIASMYNDGEYLSKNADWHVEDSPWKALQIAHIIQRNKLELKTICEVGCGAGEILRRLSLDVHFANTKFVGYEISDDAFDICRTRESDNVHYLKEDIIKSDRHYEAVLCIDVFEHVEDYMGFLRRLREKGEYKVFRIPLDLSVSAILRGTMMQRRNMAGHLHYFSPETALATLKDCGYQIIDVMYTRSFDLRPKTWKMRVARLPRKILYNVSPKLVSTLIGARLYWSSQDRSV